jgi:hypothetical protein
MPYATHISIQARAFCGAPTFVDMGCLYIETCSGYWRTYRQLDVLLIGTPNGRCLAIWDGRDSFICPSCLWTCAQIPCNNIASPIYLLHWMNGDSSETDYTMSTIIDVVVIWCRPQRSSSCPGSSPSWSYCGSSRGS